MDKQVDAQSLTNAIIARARLLGFDHCWITKVETAPHAAFFKKWLAYGRAGEMAYLERHTEKRCEPWKLAESGMPPFRSIIVLAANHYQFQLPAAYRDDPSRGIIASYAWGDDYHEIIRPVIYELDSFIRNLTGRTTRGKCLVDTGPVLERDWAHRAGIGFTGKNCCTINPESGSWLLLATVLVPEILAYDHSHTPTEKKPIAARAILNGLPPNDNYGSWQVHLAGNSGNTARGTCGRCTRCLEACPTEAFIGPYHLDPQRCISYWTIEARNPIPRELRPLFGNRLFGCDICQEVCPWNRNLDEHQPLLTELQANMDRIAPPLLDGFAQTNPYWLNQEAFSAQFRRSPVRRAKREGMLRNVCVALGNWAAPAVVTPLQIAVADREPMVRGHAAWALGRVVARQDHPDVRQLLEDALGRERDGWVRGEINMALEG